MTPNIWILRETTTNKKIQISCEWQIPDTLKLPILSHSLWPWTRFGPGLAGPTMTLLLMSLLFYIAIGIAMVWFADESDSDSEHLEPWYRTISYMTSSYGSYGSYVYHIIYDIIYNEMLAMISYTIPYI